jgi:energy-coupling factor transporter transmembrane protein EcfT
MESRAFGATKNRTNIYELKMDKIDVTVLITTVSLLFLAIYIKLYLPEIPNLLGHGLVFR